MSTFLDALENAVSQSTPADLGLAGRFLQISGFKFSWDTTAPAGDRRIDAVLNDGTVLIDDGQIVSSTLLNITMNSFIAAGGDGYEWNGGVFVDSGVVGHAALTSFITTAKGGLISEPDYPIGGEGRIQRNAQIIPEPATLALMGLGLAGIGYKRHRSKAAV